MSSTSRRHFLIGAGAAATSGLAACGNGVDSRASQRIDARVDAARDFMYANVAGTQDLAYKAAGILIMPLQTEAGFMVGGSYGRGALRVDDVTVDYYSAARASWGLQIGAQQYAHALFFMTQEALSDFRRSAGWAAGADMKYAVSNNAGTLATETTTVIDPVIAVIFGQAGLIVGASLAGTKYTRVLP